MARRKFELFSMSFLDVMACGLGAIVLFYMIINAQVSQRAAEINETQLAESSRLEEEVLDGRKDLIRVRNSLELKQVEELATASEADRLREEFERLLAELARADKDSVAQNESIEQLQSDIERLEKAKQRLAAEAANRSPETGQRIRSFVGDGNRQYLTGMKMGGARVLILVDASTSMLGRTYVNVVRFRHMKEERKRLAPKWQQVVNSVDWLTTHLSPGTRFQIYVFNEEVGSVVDGTDGTWLEVTDGSELTEAVNQLRRVTPDKGTSLIRAFTAIRELDPLPDNIYLLTDGLPTQGKVAPRSVERVKENRRIEYFTKAVAQLPRRVPVNILLYPMDGDPSAAGYFWQLAVSTGGSLLTPSQDWP
ncbi:MAG: VWA domain-containing protein [Gammaproteobacteria bacterium]|nr:MAG: VWA domain-containing protein [Gammaproteobacteria bacterium]